MFSRIEEFAEHTHGKLVVNSAIEALESFDTNNKVYFDSNWIDNERKHSLEYLIKNLKQS